VTASPWWLSQWLDGSVRPTLPGVYERNLLPLAMRDHAEIPATGYSLWDGEFWMWTRATVHDAAVDIVPSTHQTLPWRGLAYDPAHWGWQES
jgi:hypothetical protein